MVFKDFYSLYVVSSSLQHRYTEWTKIEANSGKDVFDFYKEKFLPEWEKYIKKEGTNGADEKKPSSVSGKARR